jgi:hypothetical protein
MVKSDISCGSRGDDRHRERGYCELSSYVDANGFLDVLRR